MPVWTVAPVSEEPAIFLSQWRILETGEKSIHFVGCDKSDFAGRVSSDVCQFDPVALRGMTRSGRVYQLVGPHGWSEDARYVWQRWCTVNDVVSYIDVTERLLAGTQKNDNA